MLLKFSNFKLPWYHSNFVSQVLAPFESINSEVLTKNLSHPISESKIIMLTVL